MVVGTIVLKIKEKGGEAMYKKLLFVGVFVFIFNLTYSQSQTILDVPGLGKVEADLAKMEIVFTCYNP